MASIVSLHFGVVLPRVSDVNSKRKSYKVERAKKWKEKF